MGVRPRPPWPPRSHAASVRWLLFVACGVLCGACGGDPGPDRTGPTITIATPSEGAVVDGVSLQVTGTVVDPAARGEVRPSGVASVSVNGKPARLEGAAWDVTLTDLGSGPLTLAVDARDTRGNVGHAERAVTVSTALRPLYALASDPPALALSAGQSRSVQVLGYYRGGGSRILAPSELVFTSSAEGVATVAADGTVTAVAPGATVIRVARSDLSVAIAVLVAPPSVGLPAPRIPTHLAETSLDRQVWRGFTLPHATVTIAGGAAPLVVTSDVHGGFVAEVPLAAGTVNALNVTVADSGGRTGGPFLFPVRQNPTARSAGDIHVHGRDGRVGFVGEWVPEPLRVRVTGLDGSPLAGAEVTFEVVLGDGDVANAASDPGADIADVAYSESAKTFVTTTDLTGIAQASWRLGALDLGSGNELHARLQGGHGLPAIFRARGHLRQKGATVLEGRVLDEHHIPIANMTVTRLGDGAATDLASLGKSVLTDALGHFRLAYVPELAEAPEAHSITLRFDAPSALEAPLAGRADVTALVLPRVTNDLGIFVVPTAAAGVAVTLDGDGRTTSTLVLEASADLSEPSATLRIPLGTHITWPDGLPEASRKLAFLAVRSDGAPWSLSDGYVSGHAWSLSPRGTRFDPPPPFEVPNRDHAPAGARLTVWVPDDARDGMREAAGGKRVIGYARVSADGARVVTQPTTGLAEAGWFRVASAIPGPASLLHGRLNASAGRQTCFATHTGGDVRDAVAHETGVEPGGTSDAFVLANVPGVTGDPSPSQVLVVCDTPALVITSPTAKQAVIGKGNALRFRATCSDGGASDDTITWTSTGTTPTTTTGGDVMLRFANEGRFTVTASADTPTCKGRDARVVEVKACADAGIVRVCGATIEAVGSQFQVSGGVTMGLTSADPVTRAADDPRDGTDQVLAVDAPDGVVTVDPVAVNVTGNGTLVVGGVALYRGAFTFDGEGNGECPPTADGALDVDAMSAAYVLRLGGVPVRFAALQLMAHGVFLPHPRVAVFGPWVAGAEGAPPTAALWGLVVAREGIAPIGLATLDASQSFSGITLTGLALAYAEERWTGTLDFGFGGDVAPIALRGAITLAPSRNDLRGFHVERLMVREEIDPATERRLSPVEASAGVALTGLSMAVEHAGALLGHEPRPPMLVGALGLRLDGARADGVGRLAVFPWGLDLDAALAWDAQGSGPTVVGKIGTLGPETPLALTFAGALRWPVPGVSDLILGGVRGLAGARVGFDASQALWRLPATAVTLETAWFVGTANAGSDGAVAFGGELPCDDGTCVLSASHHPTSGDTLALVEPDGTLLRLSGARGALPAAVSAGVLVAGGAPFVAAFAGDPVSFELGDDAPALTVTLARAGPFAASLVLPSGEVVGRNDPRIPYWEHFDGLHASWLVRDAEAGTYTIGGVSPVEYVTRVVAELGPHTPTFAFVDDPTASDATDELVSVAWKAVDPTGDATLVLDAVALGTGEHLELARLPLDVDSGNIAVVDRATLPEGLWAIEGHVLAFGGAARRAAIVVRGLATGEPSGAAAAPRLARAAWSDGALVVDWLPVAGAGAYGISVATPDGSVEATRVARGAATRVAFAAGELDPSRDHVLTIVPTIPPGPTTPGVTSSFGSTRLHVDADPTQALAATPPHFAHVGAPWSFTPRSLTGATATALEVVRGPDALAPSGTAFAWTPGESDLGTHHITLRWSLGGHTDTHTHTIVAVSPDGLTAPEFLDAPPRPAMLDTPLAWAPILTASGPEPPPLTLAFGPPGMSVTDATVHWTPTAADVIAWGGEVPFVLRATSPDGVAATTRTFVLHFDDADGDGLPSAWERDAGAGFDPFAASDPSADPDSDTLTNLVEATRGTLGNTTDSDGDTLADHVESDLGARTGDADDDGLGDGQESALGTDPLVADSDGDGLADGAEVAAGRDPASAKDSDGDGLFDDEERRWGSDPARADTDGDGARDGREKELGTLPGVADTDGDGATDGAEDKAGTDPRASLGDDDGDGLSDDRELTVGTRTDDLDSDDDGFDDGVEVLLATDPRDATSRPLGTVPPVGTTALLVGASAWIAVEPWRALDVGLVALLRDGDGDGVTDLRETLAGYDPTKASDGISDDDADGLPLWREIQLGTNPRVADSDDDASSDAAEAAAGTDPNNPSDTPSTGAFVRLEVTPATANLWSHDVLGPASIAFSIVGVRNDLTSADVSATARGTAYTVAPDDAGTVDATGRFTAALGFVGTLRIHITNADLSAEALLTVARFAPSWVSTLDLGAPILDLALLQPDPGAADADHAAVATGSDLVIVDLTNPAAPVERLRTPLAAPATHLAARGDSLVTTAALPSPAATLWQMIVASDGTVELARVARIPLPAPATGIAFLDHRLVLATSQGLIVVDPAGCTPSGVCDPDALATIATTTSWNAVASGLDRFAAREVGGILRRFELPDGDFSDVVSLASVPASALPEITGHALTVDGDRTFVPSPDAGPARVVWSASDAAPSVTDSSASIHAPHLALGMRTLLAADPITHKLLFLAPNDPDDLPLLGVLPFAPTAPPGAPSALAANRTHAILATDGHLAIAAYDAANDIFGRGPTVLPIAPDADTELDEGTPFLIEVAATDDIAVRDVTLAMGSRVVATLTAPPYRALVRAPAVAVATTVVVTARARDTSGNVGLMPDLPLRILPVTDTTPPSGAFLAPPEHSVVPDGGRFRVSLAASDDHGVARIELLVGDTLVQTLGAEPWVTVLDAPASAPSGRFTVTARIIDVGEQVTTVTRELVLGGTDLVAAGISAIAANDARWDLTNVLVDNGTVTIDGTHHFARLTVGPRGIITHTKLSATGPAPLFLAADEIIVAAGGAIDVSGRGDPAAHAGPGTGGSHGGIGGSSALGATPGAPDDDWAEPALGGAAGGLGCAADELGGAGGGRVRLDAARLVVDGAIRADGLPGSVKVAAGCGLAGGGAGGAIWITTDLLTGRGVISAAGASTTAQGAAGGGGRVAVAFEAEAFFLPGISAKPGASATLPAGAGTVYLDDLGADQRTLTIDDALLSGGVDNPALGTSATPITLDADVIVRGTSRLVLSAPVQARTLGLYDQATLAHMPATTTPLASLDLDVDSVYIGPSAAIDVSGRGLGSDGAPADLPTRDAWEAPTAHGRGGLAGCTGTALGGSGGGRIRLAVAQTLTLEGAIRADGFAGAPGTCGTGTGSDGGTGGAIDLTTQALAGVGTITADGGAAGGNGARRGAGGHVAVRAATLVAPFSRAHVSALPAGDATAPTSTRAAGGTLWWAAPATAAPLLVLDDAGRSGGREVTTLGFDPLTEGGEGSEPLLLGADLLIAGDVHLALLTPIAAGAVHLADRARLTHPPATASDAPDLDLTATSLTIDADAAIDVTGRGYLGDCQAGDPDCGAGAHWLGNAGDGARERSGGSHGGAGGGTRATGTYGDPRAPRTLGGGGGVGCGIAEPGGTGGGRVHLDVATVNIAGQIRADGVPGVSVPGCGSAGGGAGGAVHLHATTIAGSGLITADGGSGGPSSLGASGGGGRIALVAAATSTFDPTRVLARPGAVGAKPGGPGTIYFASGATAPIFVLDDGGRSLGADNAAFASASSAGVVALGGSLNLRGTTKLVVDGRLEAQAIVLQDHAILTHSNPAPGAPASLVIAATDIRIGATAAIDVSGRGYLGDCQPGAAQCGQGGDLPLGLGEGARDLAGGAHGGTGGAAAGHATNATYDDPFAPALAGAGGGIGCGTGEAGGNGGGRLALSAQVLVVDGQIRANGNPGTAAGCGAGGGAGGSIAIDVTTLSGAGTIAADGGAGGAGTKGAAGGGGRVALTFQSAAAFDLARATAYPGATGAFPGGAGTVARIPKNGTPTLVIDDALRSGHRDNPALGAVDSDTRRDWGANIVVRGASQLVLVEPVAFAEVDLFDTAVLTTRKTTATHESALDLRADRISVAAGAALDVTGRGYLGDCAVGDDQCTAGAHMAGNLNGGAGYYSGGSHGGLGGGRAASRAWGDPRAPTRSGGGGGFGCTGTEYGGDGGGRIRIVANALLVEGAIRADGASGLDLGGSCGRSGGGAGGSIWIDVGTLGGAGLITANGAAGGAAADGAGGAGGRIALVWDALDPSAPFDDGALTAVGGVSAHVGGAGTVVFGARGEAPTLRIDNGDRLSINETAPWPEVGLATVGSVDGASIVVAGHVGGSSPWLAGELIGAYVRFEGIDFDFPIVANTSQLLTVDTSARALTELVPGVSLVGVQTWDGEVVVRGAAVALADRVRLTRLTLESAGRLAPVAANATRLPWLHIVASEAVTLAAGTAIDATGLGGFGDCMAGDSDCGNTLGGAGAHSGGSHGGLGGGPEPGATYGVAVAPATHGAGGGQGDTSADAGGNGGGRVYLVAPVVRIDGRVAADGGARAGAVNSGGGAGGSVWIAATNLVGTGSVSALGGAGGSGVTSAGGGGGRIRLQAVNDTFGGSTNVSGGTATFAPRVGSPGTVVRGP